MSLITIANSSKYIKNYIIFLCLAISISVCLSSNANGDDRAIAIVGGEKIMKSELDILINNLSNQSLSVPTQQLRNILLRELINNKIVAKIALQNELDKSMEYRVLTKVSKERMLNDLFMKQKFEGIISQSLIKKKYANFINQHSNQDEIRASHILLKSEEEYFYQLSILLADVASRYFAVLQAEDALDSLASEIDALNTQLNQVQSLYDRQLTQITDLYQIRASLAAAQAEQLALEAQLAVNQESLRSISGLEVGPLFKLADEIEISPLEYSQEFYVKQAQENNHRVLARKLAVKAAEKGVDVSKGAHMPQVSFIAQRQDSDVGFDNLPIARTDTTYIGLNVQIPIYSGGRSSAGVSEAVSRKSIAEYELRATQLEAREAVRSTHLQIQASEAQTEAARILVESTALSLDAMQQGFSLGTVTSVDVLNAIRDQYQAERELQRIRYEHINLLLLLKRETGTLSAEDLLEVGAWLTPAAAQ